MNGPCPHHSESGIDLTDLMDSGKVWRCDGCGELSVHVDDEVTGLTRRIVLHGVVPVAVQHCVWCHRLESDLGNSGVQQ